MPHAPIPFRVVVWSVLSGLAITLPALWLISLIPGLSPSGDTLAAHAQRQAAFYLHPAITTLKALLIYPVIEELFYRGLVMQLLRRYLPTWLAVAIPTTLFAATHFGGGVANVGFAFLMGLGFSWLVIKTDSLYASILCHATVNLTALFVLNPIFQAGGLTQPADFYRVLPLTMLAGSLVLGVWAARILRGEVARHAVTAAA